GSTATGDIYVSAMPAHNLWKTLPPTLREKQPFDGLRHLHGVPVMTVQLYFDRPVTGINNLVFSTGTHISVYAELTQICPDYKEALTTTQNSQPPTNNSSMVELVIAPAAEWFRLSDEDLIAKVMAEFTQLHPSARDAHLLKSTV